MQSQCLVLLPADPSKPWLTMCIDWNSAFNQPIKRLTATLPGRQTRPIVCGLDRPQHHMLCPF